MYRFLEEYTKPTCKSGVEAALLAGYSANYAHELAANLLGNPDFIALAQERMTQRAAQADITPQLVLKHWLAVATADPSSLVRHRRLNCRHCWGVDHKYQWTARELAEAAATAFDYKEKLPDQSGGVGFRFNADPHPSCPECLGEGIADVFIADTSTVPEKDRVLFAGVKQTKDGIEIKMHDQQAAWERLHDYLGITVKRTDLTSNGKTIGQGGPLPMVETIPEDPKALEIAYREIVGQ